MRTGIRVGVLFLAVVSLPDLPFGRTVQASPNPPDGRGKPGQALAIIVNRSNPIDSLSFSELRKIFLGDRNHWPNGRRIVVAMMDYGQPERQTVLRLVFRMQEDQYQDHLLKGMFRGDVFVPPKTLASPSIVKKFVFNAPGAVGYLRADEVDASVKIVKIDGLLPQNKDYRLVMDESPSE
jgi:ABC-type phosphate transport system substrate-binding protein